MEGHALSEQTDVKLIPHIPFDALGSDLETKIA